jgi:hypothetical protein
LQQKLAPSGLVDDAVMRPEEQRQENGDLRGFPFHAHFVRDRRDEVKIVSAAAAATERLWPSRLQ